MKTQGVRKHVKFNRKYCGPLASSRLADECVSIEPSALTLKLRRILVPVDFSVSSIKALRYATVLAEQCGATISLMQVVEQALFANDLRNLLLVVSDEKLAQVARKNLISLSQKVVGRAIPMLPHVRVGKPAVEIATHGRTGVKQVLLGSVAEKVVRQAPCPVLVVRARARIQHNQQPIGKTSLGKSNRPRNLDR